MVAVIRLISVGAVALVLSGCSLPPPDQPAYKATMGRFLGLVVTCECSDITAEQMLTDYPKAVAGHYSDAEIASMKGFVKLGLSERWNNQMQICGDICDKTCMVNSVALPLGGRTTPGVAPCLPSERDIHIDPPLTSLGGSGAD